MNPWKTLLVSIASCVGPAALLLSASPAWSAPLNFDNVSAFFTESPAPKPENFRDVEGAPGQCFTRQAGSADTEDDDKIYISPYDSAHSTSFQLGFEGRKRPFYLTFTTPYADGSYGYSYQAMNPIAPVFAGAGSDEDLRATYSVRAVRVGHGGVGDPNDYWVTKAVYTTFQLVDQSPITLFTTVCYYTVPPAQGTKGRAASR